jgi:hypothetical protein
MDSAHDHPIVEALAVSMVVEEMCPAVLVCGVIMHGDPAALFE